MKDWLTVETLQSQIVHKFYGVCSLHNPRWDDKTMNDGDDWWRGENWQYQTILLYTGNLNQH